jgi:Mrp family chromosome partitioning ATPase
MIRLFRRGKSQARDPFLTLRAAVEASCKSPAVVLVSSVLPRDGKTTVSAGLAVALAKSGYATMAIDAGTEPDLSKALGVKTAPSAVKRAAEHLDIMRLDEGELRKTSSADLRRMFDQLRERYAFIVLDGSELSEGGLSAAAAVDGVLLAVRSGRPTVDDDHQATHLLDHCRARFIGVIATGARDTGPRRNRRGKGTVHPISGSVSSIPDSRTQEPRSEHHVSAGGGR